MPWRRRSTWTSTLALATCAVLVCAYSSDGLLGQLTVERQRVRAPTQRPRPTPAVSASAAQRSADGGCWDTALLEADAVGRVRANCNATRFSCSARHPQLEPLLALVAEACSCLSAQAPAGSAGASTHAPVMPLAAWAALRMRAFVLWSLQRTWDTAPFPLDKLRMTHPYSFVPELQAEHHDDIARRTGVLLTPDVFTAHAFEGRFHARQLCHVVAQAGRAQLERVATASRLRGSAAWVDAVGERNVWRTDYALQGIRLRAVAPGSGSHPDSALAESALWGEAAYRAGVLTSRARAAGAEAAPIGWVSFAALDEAARSLSAGIVVTPRSAADPYAHLENATVYLPVHSDPRSHVYLSGMANANPLHRIVHGTHHTNVIFTVADAFFTSDPDGPGLLVRGKPGASPGGAWDTQVMRTGTDVGGRLLDATMPLVPDALALARAAAQPALPSLFLVHHRYTGNYWHDAAELSTDVQPLHDLLSGVGGLGPGLHLRKFWADKKLESLGLDEAPYIHWEWTSQGLATGGLDAAQRARGAGGGRGYDVGPKDGYRWRGGSAVLRARAITFHEPVFVTWPPMLGLMRLRERVRAHVGLPPSTVGYLRRTRAGALGAGHVDYDGAPSAEQEAARARESSSPSPSSPAAAAHPCAGVAAPREDGSAQARIVLVRRRKVRVISNFDDLHAALVATGAHVSVFDDDKPIGPRETLRAFGRADIVVGAHGAGLTNAIACAEGATIVEVQQAAWAMDHFLHLAGALGLQYWRFIEPGGAQHAKTLQAPLARVTAAVCQDLRQRLARSGGGGGSE